MCVAQEAALYFLGWSGWSPVLSQKTNSQVPSMWPLEWDKRGKLQSCQVVHHDVERPLSCLHFRFVCLCFLYFDCAKTVASCSQYFEQIIPQSDTFSTTTMIHGLATLLFGRQFGLPIFFNVQYTLDMTYDYQPSK